MSVPVLPSDRDVAANVRAELARADVTWRKFARDLGLNREWLRRRVRAEVPFAATDLVKIANHLGVPVARLIEPSSSAVAATPVPSGGEADSDA